MRVKLVPIIALVLICVGASAVLASDMGIERVSVASDGTQGNNYSRMPSMNNDGRYVAFHSSANNLVPDDTNGCMDIFVRDRQTNTTTRVSISDNGTQGNNHSDFPVISGDGRYVAFASRASNLVPDDTNGCMDIFVRDRQTNTTTRVSVSDNGTQGNDESYHPSISSDGRYAAFHSNASSLVDNDTNNRADIFVHDRQTNTTTIVSVASDGTHGDLFSYNPSISGDGRYVAFESSARNLVPDDTNGMSDIFVRDRQTNTTTLVSVSDNSTQSNGTSELPSISNDGRYVAFDSLANNLVPNDINGFADIFVRDRQTNTTTRVSASDNGTEGNNLSSLPSISGDGRYVVFWSNADNLISNDTNGTRDIFVHDRQANTITRVSVASDGTQANAESELNSISGDGRYIAFDSRASNLVPNDTSGAPDVIDVFVAENPLFEHLTTSAPVASATGTGTITISTSSGGIQSLTAVSQDELLCTSLPGNVSFPHGFLSFAITDITPGSTVTITITFPAPIPEGVQYWECLNGTWVDYTSLVGDDDGDEILTLSITDGGPGDGDGQINGEISDPGGPAMPISAPAKPRVSPALPRQLNQAQISLQYLSVNPHQAAANQPLTITGNVVNTGDQAGNYNLALKINGKVEQTRSVSVGPQATQPVKFTVAKPEPGTYTVDIGGQTVSFTILGASRNSGSPSRGGLLAILIIGIMLLAATVILLISRRPA